MPEFLLPILALPAMVVGFAMLVAIAKWILGPISHAAGLLKAPLRFQLSDFVWLVVQFQVVLAVCAQGLMLDDFFGFGLALTLLFGVTTAMWMGAVSCVSKAGVVNPWRRAVFVLCQLPLTLAFMFAIPICLGAALLSCFQFAVNRSLGFEEGSGLQIVGLLSLSLLLGLAGWGLRYVSIWVLQGSSWAKSQVPAAETRACDALELVAVERAISTETAGELAARRLPRTFGESS